MSVTLMFSASCITVDTDASDVMSVHMYKLTEEFVDNIHANLTTEKIQ